MGDLWALRRIFRSDRSLGIRNRLRSVFAAPNVRYSVRVKIRNMFLSGPDEDPGHRELTFSKNCVSLEISGPEANDLSFCDLPGIAPFPSRHFPWGCELNIFEKASLPASSRWQHLRYRPCEGSGTTYICKPSCLILSRHLRK